MDCDRVDFRFNFGTSEASESGDSRGRAPAATPTLPPALEVFPPSTAGKATFDELPLHIPPSTPGPRVLLKARAAHAQAALEEGLRAASDLVPGVYEGGFKLWECALDLVEYMATTPTVRALLPAASVAELGCGHGLPGIYAALVGAGKVHFQDFNAEVLTTVTASNVAANLAAALSSPAAPEFRYFAGDWKELARVPTGEGGSSLWPGGVYDLLLTSETIYSVDAQEGLYGLIRRRPPDRQSLRPASGVALVAAKAYYFGVGGSVVQFSELVAQRGEFTVEEVATKADGVSNVRHILCLRWRG